MPQPATAARRRPQCHEWCVLVAPALVPPPVLEDKAGCPEAAEQPPAASTCQARTAAAGRPPWPPVARPIVILGEAP